MTFKEQDHAGRRRCSEMSDLNSSLDPEVRAAWAELKCLDLPEFRQALGFPQRRKQFAVESAFWSQPSTPGVASELLRVNLLGRELSMRRFVPAVRQPGTLLYCHGGGWCIGDHNTNEGLAGALALACQREVLTIDYALAPEHPYPRALNEIVAVCKHLASSGPLWLAGDSAGANMALAATLYLLGQPAQPALLLLFYGVYDAVRDTASYRENGDGRWGLSTEEARAYFDAYASAASLDDPLVHPLRADLRGLPPTFVLGAALDCLRDDSRLLAKRLAEAQVPSEFLEVPGVPHGFMKMQSRVRAAATALRQAADFSRRHHL
jgi:acetyl esterase